MSIFVDISISVYFSGVFDVGEYEEGSGPYDGTIIGCRIEPGMQLSRSPAGRFGSEIPGEKGAVTT